jgi:hypothetical protein
MPFDERYPILTEDISSELPPSGSSSTTSTTPGGDFQRTVTDALRNVLGIRIKGSDAPTITKALANAFTIIDSDGVQSYILNPTSLSIDASNGDVTGLQKVLLLEAQDVVKTCTPLILGLTPIGIYNQEDIEPLRSLTAATLQDLATEFAYPGGLRPQILDTLFLNLLGDQPLKPGEYVHWSGGYFAAMQGVMNLQKNQIRFTDDERVYTDFLTAAHMTYNLYDTWNSNRSDFSAPDKDRYLGELQYLLSRALDVVHEKRNTLVVIANSVFVNPADLYNFYLGETLKRLHKLVEETRTAVVDTPDVPHGCKTDRFITALMELSRALDIARRRVEEFPRNTMTISGATIGP